MDGATDVGNVENEVMLIQYYLFQYLFEHLCYVHVHVNRHVYVCMYSYTAKLVYTFEKVGVE